MDDRIITYLNDNVHKIAQFKVHETVIYIEFTNGDTVRILSTSDSNKLELDFTHFN